MSKADTTSKLSIHLALVAIIQGLDAIGKERKNEQQGFKFRGIDDIYNNLHPLFAKFGVVCVPKIVDIVSHPVFLNAKGNNVFRVHVKAGYVFTASDGSQVEAVTVGEGMDFADKATNKALSAAQKYALIQTFLIPTADLADADAETIIDAAGELKDMANSAKREEELAKLQKELEEKRADLEKQAATATDKATPAPPAPPVKPKTPKPKAAEAEAPADPTPEPPKEQPKAPEPAAQAPAETLPGTDTNAPAWDGHVIEAITHKSYKGRRVGDLSLPELEVLNTNWSDKADFQEGIAADPAKATLRTHLKAALEARRAQQKK